MLSLHKEPLCWQSHQQLLPLLLFCDSVAVRTTQFVSVVRLDSAFWSRHVQSRLNWSSLVFLESMHSVLVQTGLQPALPFSAPWLLQSLSWSFISATKATFVLCYSRWFSYCVTNYLSNYVKTARFRIEIRRPKDLLEIVLSLSLQFSLSLNTLSCGRIRDRLHALLKITTRMEKIYIFSLFNFFYFCISATAQITVFSYSHPLGWTQVTEPTTVRQSSAPEVLTPWSDMQILLLLNLFLLFLSWLMLLKHQPGRLIIWRSTKRNNITSNLVWVKWSVLLLGLQLGLG